MNNRFFYILMLLFVPAAFNFAKAQAKIFPVPTGNVKQLFYLQRTTNTNTIIYELNYAGTLIDKDDPVHAYWIRYSENGQTEDLNYVQRKFAYGINSKEIGTNKFELTFVSYKKYKMYLMVGSDKQYHIYTTINKRQIILNKIFIQVKGGSFWSPNIEFVELTGLDPITNLPVKERLIIK